MAGWLDCSKCLFVNVFRKSSTSILSLKLCKLIVLLWFKTNVSCCW
jgi:hypothetical protein